MVSRSMTQVGTWSRRIVVGALVLTFAGLSVPAITSARVYQDDTPEVIEVEGEAPWNPPNYGGHNGSGAPNGTPSGDSGGGGGGPVSAGGGGGTNHPSISRAEWIASLKAECTLMNGQWRRTAFNDYKTEKRIRGYSCLYNNSPEPGVNIRVYYDDQGDYNHRCEIIGDDVKICYQ
jgi:hypothetical protein